MKSLTIEWRHLDKAGNTCVRCSDTGAELDAVAASLAAECRPCGWEIGLRETRLDERRIAQSNLLLFNGIPIENLLPNAGASENHCESCCEFTGHPTFCRTLAVGDRSYEAIPAALIRQAACNLMQCC